MACHRVLPGFRSSCLSVGVLYVVLAGSILLRGVEASMAPFGVPRVVLGAPHYENAII